MIRILGVTSCCSERHQPSSYRWRVRWPTGVTLLADRGFDSLDAYAGVENLEERMWPDGDPHRSGGAGDSPQLASSGRAR
jgi:hypothetical protein